MMNDCTLTWVCVHDVAGLRRCRSVHRVACLLIVAYAFAHVVHMHVAFDAVHLHLCVYICMVLCVGDGIGFHRR